MASLGIKAAAHKDEPWSYLTSSRVAQIGELMIGTPVACAFYDIAQYTNVGEY